MRRTGKNRILLLALCLLFAFAACGQRVEPTPPPTETGTYAPWEPETIPAIPGEESAPPDEPAGETDGLEGSYYNDFLRETLVLDGRGGCSISWQGGVMSGTYVVSDGALALLISDLRLRVAADARGDLTIGGKTGRYLRDWDFWGITPAEVGLHPVAALPDTEEVALGGGLYRYRDFPAGIALTYDGALQIAAGRLSGAVTVADGKGGYVVGRNVTQEYLTRSGSTEDFLDAYLRDLVFSDAAVLYGAVGGYDDMTLFSGETAGRLGAVEAKLFCSTQEIAARVILYSSAFADGTENFICRCVLAPASGTAQLDALAAGVTDMGAARIVETE